jgi:diguanylate cyclase (GGDEF)-like protein
MDASLVFFLIRAGFGVVALGLAARLIFTATAYRSWHTYLYFGLTLLAAGLLLGLRLSSAGDLSGSYLAALVDVIFVAGVVGVLYETWRSDQLRLRDLRRLMDQRRQAIQLAETRLRELELLAAVNRELAASLNLNHVLEVVVNKARQFGDADGVSILVHDADTGTLVDHHVMASARNLPPPRPQALTHQVAGEGVAAFISDVAHHPLLVDSAYPELQAIASLPLKVGETVVGVMNVGYNRPFHFGEATKRLLTALAEAAALAVHNAAQHERIRRQAVTDELTGLNNRRRFLEVLRGEMARARRYGHPLSLLMVDLDHLKQINDENGHAAGDAMLRGVAQCLRASLRTTDVPARLGGDEFAVLMPETGRAAALVVAERIRAAVENFEVPVDGRPIQSTVSVGLMSRAVGHLQDLPSLIHKADDALYRSKTGGRNRVTVWDPDEPSPTAAIDSSAISE